MSITKKLSFGGSENNGTGREQHTSERLDSNYFAFAHMKG